MPIPSFDSPREGSSTTFELLPLDDHPSFSSLLKAYLLSYFKSSSTTSASKVVTNGTSMVIIIVWGLTKCKLWPTLWCPSYDLPQLPPYAYIISTSFFSS
jgi:hypothetical protein